MSEQPQQTGPTTAETIEKPDFQSLQRLVENPQRGLQLKTLEEMWRFAQIALDSKWVPSDMTTVPDAFMAIQYGAELGLSPMVSLKQIAIINGRPSVWGDVMLALCHYSGLFDEEAFEEWYSGTCPNDDFTAHCRVKRKGAAKPRESSFSVADAKRAKLWAKKTYQEYPQRMLLYRARAFTLRDAFTDVLQGLYSKEEMGVTQAMDALDLTGNVRPPMTDETLAKQLTTAPAEGPIATAESKPTLIEEDFLPQPVSPEPAPQPESPAPEPNPEVVDVQAEPVPEPAAKKAKPKPKKAMMYELLVKLYNALTPAQLDPIREAKGFGMISEYETRSPEDQTDLRILLEEAAEETKT